MKLIKTLCALACTFISLSAAAQNDSIKVTIDFDENPWNMATCPYGLNSKGKKSWGSASYDPAESRLDKTTVFEVAACGDKLTMTVTPSDLDETDYDNAYVRDEDYDDPESNVRSYLYMYIGSKMTFKAPKNYRMAKVKFNTYRSWSSGGLSNNDCTWGPDTAKIHIQYNDKGEETYRTDSWYGDACEWSTPAVTSATRLRSVDFWLLPADESAISSLATEQKAVNVVSANGAVVRRATRMADAIADLPKGVYIIEGKKYVVK